MPGPYGVTAQGFNPKTFDESRSDLESAWKTAFGAGVDTSDDSPDGVIIGIFADRFAALWQGLASVYDGSFAESASEVALNRVAALSPGIIRQAATQSLVVATLAGTPATLIPAGSRARIAGSDVLFELIADATLDGSGNATANMRAVNTGPRRALAGTLTVIETPVFGWASVVNASDQFYLGTDLEKDPAFRARRDQSMRVNGSSSDDAIRAAVLEVPNVTSARVFSNETDGTVDGMPPHSIEAVVLGGSDAAIAQAIYGAKPSGQPSHGNTTAIALDSIGNNKEIKFSRPVPLLAYVTVNVTVNKNAPDNADQVIASALAAWGDLNLQPDSELVAQALVPSVFAAVPGGVFDCAPPLIGLAPAPVASTTIYSTPRQIIDLDTSRITVNVTRI